MKITATKRAMAWALALCMIFTLLPAIAPTAQAAADVWNGSVASTYAGGDGSAETPYLIATGAQLAYFSNQMASGAAATPIYNKHFKLTADIDLNNLEWTPIGTENLAFVGTFDGDGHTIDKMKITTLVDGCAGLFVFLGGTIKNLGVTNVNITVSKTGNVTVGGLVAFCQTNDTVTYPTITNCYTTGTVSGTNTQYNANDCGVNVGGLVGTNNQGKITGCYSTVNVTGSAIGATVGGLVGRNQHTQKDDYILNCYATGTVSGTSDGTAEYSYQFPHFVRAGGLVGTNGAGNTIKNSYATGAVTGIAGSNIGTENVDVFVGGLVGHHGRTSDSQAGAAVINNCYSSGAVSGTATAGGTANVGAFVGKVISAVAGGGNPASQSTVTNGYWIWGSASGGDGSNTINIAATSKTAAEMQAQTFVNTLNTNGGSITDAAEWSLPTAGQPNGGFPIFKPEPDGSADNPYLITTVAELAALAAEVNGGDNKDGKHYKLMNNLDLNVAPYNTDKGWTPIGNNITIWFKGTFDGNGKTISNLFINDNKSYKGLFGHINGATVKNLGIINANITGGSNVGGIVGRALVGNSPDFRKTYVENCFVTGTVTGTSNVGGLVGESASAHVKNCYSTADVTGSSNQIGGVVGSVGEANEQPSSVSYCYSTGTVTGGDYVGGVAGGNFSSVSYCAALNKSVKSSGSGTNVGRVAGQKGGTATLSNNHAFSRIKNKANTTVWSNKGAGALDGADITSEQIIDGTTLLTLLSNDPNPWKTGTNKLPDFVGGITMPAHLLPAPSITVTVEGLTGLKFGKAVSGAKVVYTLSNGTYADPITTANFTVTGLPAGLTAGTAERKSPTVVEIPITSTPTAANASAATLGFAASIPEGNVTDAADAIETTGTIEASAVAKANALALTHGINIASTNTDPQTFNVTTVSGYPTDAGTVNFTLETPTNTDGVLKSDALPSIGGTTLTYTGGGQETNTATQIINMTSDNYELSTITITFTAIPKPSATVTVTAPADITYGATLGDPEAEADAGGTDFTYTYTGTLADGNNTPYNTPTVKPTEPGSYTVEAELASGSTHMGSGTADFTISKKDLSWATGGTATAKTYDGTTTATAATQPTLSGDINSDTVTVTEGTIAFADANAGTKAVTASGYGVGGTHAWKYNAPAAQPTFASATINKKDISINTVAALTKPYDGTLTATAGAVTFSGEVSGQTLELTTDYTVSAVFTDDANAGGSKAYTYTITMLSTPKANNYNLATNTKTGSDGTISVASALALTHTISIPAWNTTQQTFDVTTVSNYPTHDTTMTLGLGAWGGTTSVLSAAPSFTSPTLTYTGAGLESGTATQVITLTSTNYASSTITITINAVAKTPQIIAFTGVIGNAVAKTFGDAAFTETATLSGSGSGNAITYASGTPAVATVNSSTGEVTILTQGTTVITATKLGDTTYADATASYTLTVSKKAASNLTIDAIPDQKYTGVAITPTIRVKDGTTVLATPADYTVTGYTSNTAVGTATVTITGAGNYDGTKTANFKIIKADQAPLTVTGVKSFTTGGFTPGYSGGTGGGAVTYSYSGTGSTSYGPSSLQPTAAGTYQVTATRAGDTNYNPVISAPVQFSITDAPTYTIAHNVTGNTHSFGNATLGYGAQPAKTVTITNTGTGALTSGTIELAGSDFTLSKTTLGAIAAGATDTFTVRPNTGLTAGTYTDTVTVTGAPDDKTAVFTVSFTVKDKQNQTPFTVTGVGNYTAGGTPFTPGVSGGESSENPTYLYTGTGSTTYGPSATPPAAIGTYQIIATKAEDTTYNAYTTVPVKFSVVAAPTYTIALSRTGTHIFPDAVTGYTTLPSATVSVTNTGTGDVTGLSAALTAGDTGNFTITAVGTPALKNNEATTFVVTPNSGLVAGTYTATVTVTGSNSTTATFDVSFKVKTAVTVTADDAQTKTAGQQDPTLTFTSSIGPLSGTLARAPGETEGQYAITLGNLAASNPDYVITFVGSYFTIGAAPAPAPTGEISGKVTDDSGLNLPMTVSLELGNKPVASVIVAMDGGSGTFSFGNLVDGFYNVVADNGEYKVTEKIQISGGSVASGVWLTVGKTQSVVEVKAGNGTTPDVAVGGLSDLFTENPTDTSNYTAADAEVVSGGGTVELKLAAEGKAEATVQTDANAIKAVATGKKVDIFVDFSVLKTAMDSAGETVSSEKLTMLDGLLEITFPIPAGAAGKDGIAVYRYHGSAAEALPTTQLTLGAEYCTIDPVNGYITLHVKKFSTYAVGYTADTSGGTGSGNGTGGTTSNVIITTPENGVVTHEPANPANGDKVTITVKPNTGYTLDKLTVTDANGNAVSVTENGDGTYTYTQPNGKVTVTAAFKKTAGTFDPDSDVSGLLNTGDHNAYVQGRGNNLFAPNANMSRAEVAQMFYNLLNDKNVPITKTFPDVASGAWYAAAVNTLASMDIIAGFPDGGFRPNDNITRAQFAAIVVRFAKISGGSIRFNDVSSSHWAYDYINTAANFGWVTGVGNGKFDPDRNITRAEVVTLTNRMLRRYPDKVYINAGTGLTQFTDVGTGYWAYYDIAEAANTHDYERDGTAEAWK